MGLCDTVNVYFSALGVMARDMQIIKTEYNTLLDRYNGMELGQPTVSLASLIRRDTLATIKRQVPTSSQMQEAIDKATQLITGGTGGHVVLATDGDGKPNEILIMDTEDISTAVKVLRINQNGIGFSSTGYNGRDFEAALDNVNTAYYTVYEESGFSHAIYAEMSIEDREAADGQFSVVKGIAQRGAEKFESKKFKRETKELKKLLGAKATAMDEKKAAEEAVAAAETAAQTVTTEESAQSDPGWLTFLGAFGIIIREGLEAILVIAAIIAYLVKSGNGKSLKNVYIGAIAGIIASFIAAAILYYAKQAFAGAGVAQEVIEGITALIAVCVLFYVSNWMISKAEAATWSHYIDSRVQSGVERNSAFALAFTAFLSVFREGAEVVLFYQPMLQEGNAGMVWAGFGAGVVILVFVYLAITKLSIKLPIKVFFTATSILMAVMCVAFLGSGIKELAEGNVFDLTMYVTGVPENDVVQVFGIYPYLETLVPQLILAIILLVTFMIAHYRGKIAAVRAEYEGKKPAVQ